MTLIRYTAAIAPVLSVEQAKRHLRIDADITGRDQDVAELVADATDYVENETGRALVRQQWLKKLDAFPCRGQAIEITRPPVMAIDRIDYVDVDGATVTLSPACYELDPQSERAWLVPAYGYVWPEARDQVNAVTITFTCGQTAPEMVPPGLLRVIKLLIRHWYDNPGAVNVGSQVSEMPLAVQMLIAQYRVMRYV